VNESVDILENDITRLYPGVLEILLYDHSTLSNIIWATDNYRDLGDAYQFDSPITTEHITENYGHVIMPRVEKNKKLQKERSREMAEVFTPSWVCNAQNNLIDESWFGKKDVFNHEVFTPEGGRSWESNNRKVQFPDGKSWKDYIRDKRLEVTCGEAPYITSRYDSTTGKFIPIHERIGILDRKLKVISENTIASGEWLKAAQLAFKSTYAYEWQGDSLLLARESMLVTFIENYKSKFLKDPQLKSIRLIAEIISWNVWQMDGLKGVVPNSCTTTLCTEENLFGEMKTTSKNCEGCEGGDVTRHNGIKCKIKEWSPKKKNAEIYFVDLLTQNDL